MGIFEILGKSLEKRRENISNLKDQYSSKSDGFLISILRSNLGPGANPFGSLTAEAGVAFEELKSRGYSDEELRSAAGR